MYRREFLSAATATAGVGALAGLGRGGASRRAASQDDEPFEPLGFVGLDGTRELAVSDDGSVAYVAVDDGIATVDLSDPTDPTVLAERRSLLDDQENGPLRLLWDVWPDGDRLLAAGPANGLTGFELRAALLFDVSDPADPELLDVHETDYPIHNCFYADGLAYLTANGGQRNELVVLDAADGFTELSRWSIQDHDEEWRSVPASARQIHDVYVQDGVAYLPYWDAGTWLVDVSDPESPSSLGHTGVHDREALSQLHPIAAVQEARTPPGNAHYVEVDETGELMAVGREAWARTVDGQCVEGGAGDVDLYDVSDHDAIEHLATIEAPESYLQTTDGPFTTSHNFELVDGRLYSSWYFGGVTVHDVSDPAEPREIAWWRDPEETAFWTARRGVADEFFVASSTADVAGYRPGYPGRVYVFPDRAGEQPDPPSLVEPPESGEALPNCEDAAAFGDDGGQSDDGSDEDGSNGDGGESDGGESSDGEASDGEQEADGLPGFGVGGAVAGLGLGAGWLRRRASSGGASGGDASADDGFDD